ncbi:bifunctional acetate--CoA ligase family protein/GNAT family N-acetyltransferase [Photobacterium atrarenae]|uniref:Bifunctional acetate--CoA ligase family protein/GNAT family N-acetyltransferase n=1 Tax=Photobacterium atrarenae TaxID=865757 RepID=A0ABY5GML3_9GAMM|nr:bifunctional acetate--CoA ligase family protein/GNAT family N-acetyltransferase [Photobacterium atrarenae]UTV30025.1 bifunctional acetate--CoA ligase family protein/GNAT family N-acetyltransferase [Photobacterium atrarenae]
MEGLDKLLKPKSITVIGASDNPSRAGNVVIRNLLAGSFHGPIMPVTPKYDAVAGVLAYPTIDSLPRVPDLAIVCTNAHRNVDVIRQLGEKGVKVAIVLAAGMNTVFPGQNETEEDRMFTTARQYGMRLVGPNSMGLILPWLNLNASFSPVAANQGNIAFISQSAAVCTTILDWAKNKSIGFSTFLSLGDACDINFAELLDYLCRDSKTEAILLYVDSIKDARRFMSAARAAARNRRILVLKSGRTRAGSAAAYLHTGGEIGLDGVYDAAIRRAGMLRVHNTHELFAAVETLAHSVPLRGERLAILTNGGGPAVMAVDALADRGGKLAQLSPETVEKLSEVLPACWSHANPIDIIGDAGINRYEKAIRILLDSDDFDALLIMHSPSAIAPGNETARRLVHVLQSHPRTKRFNILSNWAGENEAALSRQIFTEAGFPAYRTPESAVSAFMHLVEYRRNQKQLMETPVSYGETAANPRHVHDVLNHLLAQGTSHLETHEVRPVLESYGFSTLPTWIATDPAEAAHIAEQIGYPVAVKLRSPDIRHKSEIHGVMLHLRTAAEVANSAQAILDRVTLNYPNARIDGLLVQRMANRSGAQELRISVHHDAVFGPVIFMGEDAAEWDIHKDAAVALPPLNMALARYMVINAIKTGKIKQRSFPERIDIPALCRLLVKISQLIIDCPEIESFDIHPLLAAGEEMTVIDVSMSIKPFDGDKQTRLAIRPYPKEHEQQVTLKDGSEILLRPILPEDEPKHKAFISKVSVDDLYRRFFSDVGEFNHEALANLTQIDYDREMAFVATRQITRLDGQQDEEIIGVTRALSDPENEEAEFAILVRSDLKGVGLGRILMTKIIDYSRQRGLERLTGMTMPSNRGMIMLAQKVGFSIDIQMEDGIVEMMLPLK